MTDETLYVYAVVPADTPAPSVTGIDGRPLRLITAPSGLAAVVHPHESGPYEGPDEDVKRWVLQHSDVVEDCWTRAASVLPVSFNVIVRASEETATPPRSSSSGGSQRRRRSFTRSSKNSQEPRSFGWRSSLISTSSPATMIRSFS